MSAFNGRWKLQSSVNMTEYAQGLSATGVLKEETLAQLTAMEAIGANSEEHVKTVTDSNLKTEMYIGGKLLVTQFATLGEECEIEVLAGVKTKSLTTVDGNTITTKSLGKPEFSTIQTVDGDKLTVVMKAIEKDVTCTRIYKRM